MFNCTLDDTCDLISVAARSADHRPSPAGDGNGQWATGRHAGQDGDITRWYIGPISYHPCERHESRQHQRQHATAESRTR